MSTTTTTDPMSGQTTWTQFGPDGVRVDGAGHLVWEGVETTIDGSDWVARVLTY